MGVQNQEGLPNVELVFEISNPFLVLSTAKTEKGCSSLCVYSYTSVLPIWKESDLRNQARFLWQN